MGPSILSGPRPWWAAARRSPKSWSLTPAFQYIVHKLSMPDIQSQRFLKHVLCNFPNLGRLSICRLLGQANFQASLVYAILKFASLTLGKWLAEQGLQDGEALAIDGKTLRGIHHLLRAAPAAGPTDTSTSGQCSKSLEREIGERHTGVCQFH